MCIFSYTIIIFCFLSNRFFSFGVYFPFALAPEIDESPRRIFSRLAHEHHGHFQFTSCSNTLNTYNRLIVIRVDYVFRRYIPCLHASARRWRLDETGAPQVQHLPVTMFRARNDGLDMLFILIIEPWRYNDCRDGIPKIFLKIKPFYRRLSLRWVAPRRV